MLLTDCAEGIPLLEANAARNAPLARPHGGVLRAAELLWGEAEHVTAAGRGGFDVVLGADVIYHQPAAEMAAFVGTIAELLAPAGRCLIAYEWREDWETTDAFHEECDARGLRVETGALCDADMDEQILFTVTRAVE